MPDAPAHGEPPRHGTEPPVPWRTSHLSHSAPSAPPREKTLLFPIISRRGAETAEVGICVCHREIPMPDAHALFRKRAPAPWNGISRSTAQNSLPPPLSPRSLRLRVRPFSHITQSRRVRRVNVPNRGALAPFAGHLPGRRRTFHLSFLLTPRPPRLRVRHLPSFPIDTPSVLRYKHIIFCDSDPAPSCGMSCLRCIRIQPSSR